MQDNGRIRAGFGARMAAYAVDRLLLLLALGFVRVPALLISLFTGGVGQPVLFDHTALDIVCYLLSSLYFVLMTYCCGATLGKMLMGLRVESRNGERMTFLNVLYRETVGRFLSGILYVGYLLALVDSRGRAFHDWLCDSRVVYSRLRAAQEPEDEALCRRYPA